MISGVINASVNAATATRGSTIRRKILPMANAEAAALPVPFHSCQSARARRKPSVPEMTNADISKMPCGIRAAAM
jgi:hypothetical protein